MRGKIWFFNFWALLKMYIFVVLRFFSCLVVIHSTSPPPLHFRGVGQYFQFQIFQFQKGGVQNECLGNLNSSCHEYLPGGLICFLSKKNLKIWPWGQFQKLILVCLSQTTYWSLVLGHLVLLNHLNNIGRN